MENVTAGQDCAFPVGLLLSWFNPEEAILKTLNTGKRASNWRDPSPWGRNNKHGGGKWAAWYTACQIERELSRVLKDLLLLFCFTKCDFFPLRYLSFWSEAPPYRTSVVEESTRVSIGGMRAPELENCMWSGNSEDSVKLWSLSLSSQVYFGEDFICMLFMVRRKRTHI